MIEITPERQADAPAVERLLDEAFGLGRHAKISYRYRVGVARVGRLSLVAREGARLIGTIRYWPVRVEGLDRETPALLLGPIAVDPAYRAVGLGAALMRLSLGLAASFGHRLVVLVGDEPYYRRFGFVAAAASAIAMADENPARVLMRWLGPPETGFAGGTVERARGGGEGF